MSVALFVTLMVFTPAGVNSSIDVSLLFNSFEECRKHLIPDQQFGKIVLVTDCAYLDDWKDYTPRRPKVRP